MDDGLRRVFTAATASRRSTKLGLTPTVALIVKAKRALNAIPSDWDTAFESLDAAAKRAARLERERVRTAAILRYFRSVFRDTNEYRRVLALGREALSRYAKEETPGG